MQNKWVGLGLTFGVSFGFSSILLASSIFSDAPSGAAKPGPLVISSPEIRQLVLADGCAKAAHDRIVKMGKDRRAEMIVIQDLRALEDGKSYGIKVEGKLPVIVKTKIKGAGCAVASAPKASALF